MDASNYSSTDFKTSSEDDLIGDNQIDPDILRILGLEDVFDLDQEDYMSLLKEAISKGAFDEKAKLSQEDLAKIANEKKRIRDKKDVKFTSKKIDKDSFFNTKSKEDPGNRILDPKKILPPSGGIKLNDIKEDQDDETENELNNLKNFLTKDLFNSIKDISSIVKNIETLLQNRNNLLTKESEFDRKESVKSRFREQESGLEDKKQSKTEGILSQITKPFTSLFDTISKFLMNVLAGSFLNWLLSVFEDPRKLLQPVQDLLDNIFNFFNDIINWMDNTFVNPIRYLIDTVNNGISGFIDILNSALSLIPGTTPIESPQIPNIPEPTQLEAPDIVGRNETNNKNQSDTAIQTANKGGLIVNLKKDGGNVQNIVNNSKKNNIIQNTYNSKNETSSIYDPIAEKGGKVDSNTGLRVKGLEPDTQLTALKKDEFVLVPGAARALGINRLESLNKKFGGDNKERYVSLMDKNVKVLSGGGRVVTSGLGMRGLAISPGMHMGVDISGTIGEPLKSFTDGVIEDKGTDSGYGNYVNWIDTSGIGHFYAHMNKPASVAKNQRVRSGTKIGELGDTGRSTGPHLHWEAATNPKDNGKDKSAVLSRFNPLSKYSKNAPFGGVAGSPEMPDSELPLSESETSELAQFDKSKMWFIKGDKSNPRNKGFRELGSSSQTTTPGFMNPNTSINVSPKISGIFQGSRESTSTNNTPNMGNINLMRNSSSTGGKSILNKTKLWDNKNNFNQNTNSIIGYNFQQIINGLPSVPESEIVKKYQNTSGSNLLPANQTPSGQSGMMERLRVGSERLGPSSKGVKIPEPPSGSGKSRILPLPLPKSKSKQQNSGALSGSQGSSVPEFSSVNFSESSHIGSVRSVLGLLEY
jgi:murein DD-endopeptidase MepM/ murein hydrolase activator NlpD